MADKRIQSDTFKCSRRPRSVATCLSNKTTSRRSNEGGLYSNLKGKNLNFRDGNMGIEIGTSGWPCSGPGGGRRVPDNVKSTAPQPNWENQTSQSVHEIQTTFKSNQFLVVKVF